MGGEDLSKRSLDLGNIFTIKKRDCKIENMYHGIFEKIYIYLHTDMVTIFLIQGYHWSDGGREWCARYRVTRAEQSLLVNIYYFSRKYLSQLDFDRSVPWGWVLPIIFLKEGKKRERKKKLKVRKPTCIKWEQKGQAGFPTLLFCQVFLRIGGIWDLTLEALRTESPSHH